MCNNPNGSKNSKSSNNFNSFIKAIEIKFYH